MFGKAARRPFRDAQGRVITVPKAVAAQLDALWAAFHGACARAATYAADHTYPRSLHDEIKRAGANLVTGQTSAGVWLIHPANAVPGYRDTDPRIIDDQNSSTMLTITEKVEDGLPFVEVTNAAGERLFCHVSVDKAVRALEEDNCMLGAAVFQDVRLVPKVAFQIVRLDLKQERSNRATPLQLAA